MLLVVGGGCASVGQTRTVIRYQSSQPLEPVRVEAVNATGGELPVPPPGLIEQAARLVMQQAPRRFSIPDAFATAAAERLGSMSAVAAGSDSAAPLLRISLERWDVRDGQAAGGVVFVTADYQLLDPQGQLLWRARQEQRPVRLSGPNLSRYEVARVARMCVDDALASLLAARR